MGYMDDWIILGKSCAELHQLRYEIQDYLRTNLDLELKGNYQVFPVESRGVDFVGYRTFPSFTLIRTRNKRSIRFDAHKLYLKVKNNKHITLHDYLSIQSKKGMLKWCDSYHFYYHSVAIIEPYIQRFYELNLKQKKKKKRRKKYGKIYS